MNLKKIAVACAAVAVGQMAWAENINVTGLDLSSGSVFFGATHFQLDTFGFTDTFQFLNGPPLADASVALVTISLGNRNIDFTSARLNGRPLTITGPVGSETASLTWDGATGPIFALAVEGISSGIGNGLSASYSGVMNVTAVPEPGTFALMFAGLSAVGFMAARRRNS